MTAHAQVAHMLVDGQIRAVYVHHAEPAALVGPLLARQYHGAAQLAALLDLGDLSVLAATPADCVAYGRDYGETGTAAQRYPDAEALVAAADTSSCVYLWREALWYVWLHDHAWYRLKPTGYVAWHGPVAALVEEMVLAAHALQRPFTQAEVITPLWDAGYGVMLHLDDRFQLYGDAGIQSDLWIVTPTAHVVAA